MLSKEEINEIEDAIIGACKKMVDDRVDEMERFKLYSELYSKYNHNYDETLVMDKFSSVFVMDGQENIKVKALIRFESFDQLVALVEYDDTGEQYLQYIYLDDFKVLHISKVKINNVRFLKFDDDESMDIWNNMESVIRSKQRIQEIITVAA